MASTDASAISKDNPLYELALTVDVTQVPDKVKCKICEGFLLNAEMSDCCSTAMCEKCVEAAISAGCPKCKHQPFSSTPKKALRNTAKAILKGMHTTAEANKIATISTSELANQASIVPIKEESQIITSEQLSKEAIPESVFKEDIETEETASAATAQIYTPMDPKSQTIGTESAEAAVDNQDVDDDDDIEINVGEAYDVSQLEQLQPDTPDELDAPYHETGRKSSTFQQPLDQKKEQSFTNTGELGGGSGVSMAGNSSSSSTNNNNSTNNTFGNNASAHNGTNIFDMNMQPSMDPSMMQNMMLMMQNGNGTFDSNTFMNMMHTNPVFFQNSMNYMQSWNMNGMAAGNMNGMNSWFPNNLMGQGGFPNMNNMFNNGAGFAQQQYQQFSNGDSRSFNQIGKFSRGNRRGRGRRGGYYQQDALSNYNIPNQSQNNYGQYSNYLQNMQDMQSQVMNQNSQNFNTQMTSNDNSNNEPEPEPDNDDFAPGGREDVEEALGDEYSKAKAEEEADTAVEQVAERLNEAAIAQELQEDTPAVSIRELSPFADSPAVEESRMDETIPEAYREDIDYAMAPPAAPLGPSSKDVSFRSRGHSRFSSRTRGSFQSSNGYPPRSPVRSVSQTQIQNQPSPTNKGSGVVGAPTGPRAMRQQDGPVNKGSSRSDSDMGLKIMGRASTQVKETNHRDGTVRSVTPRSGHEDYDDDKSNTNGYRSSRRDPEYSGSRREEHDDYERERDRKRRKSSRRDEIYNKYDFEDDERDHLRSDSPERSSMYKSSRRERERRDRDKYTATPSSSRHKTSSRRDEDAQDEEVDDRSELVESKSYRSSKKSSSRRDEERDRERDSRDHERSEKDKNRKRSRHDREREEDYEDDDETEHRRRSRKHKREHGSGRKERDRDYEDTDLGIRISGRSSHRNSEVASAAVTPQPDKDPHTLEREARNKERMLKEQQRRENAAKGTLSGGRKISYKYEDEIEPRISKSRRR